MAKNAGERFGNVLFYGLILLLVYLVYRIFEPFLVPLGWAAVFAVIFHSLNQDSNENGGATSRLGEHDRRHFDSGCAFPALDDFIRA